MNFPKKIEASMTLFDVYDPAMQIETQQDADTYFEILVDGHMRAHGTTRADAERDVRSSLGYWSGYYDQATRVRVESLYRCEHPFLGPASRQLSPKEILEIGMRLGEQQRKSP